jgi:hypothetical protein
MTDLNQMVWVSLLQRWDSMDANQRKNFMRDAGIPAPRVRRYWRLGLQQLSSVGPASGLRMVGQLIEHERGKL